MKPVDLLLLSPVTWKTQIKIDFSSIYVLYFLALSFASIYSVKDQWSSFILHLVVVPNTQLATTIEHVYLDYTEKHCGKFGLFNSGVTCIQYILCFSDHYNLCC